MTLSRNFSVSYPSRISLAICNHFSKDSTSSAGASGGYSVDYCPDTSCVYFVGPCSGASGGYFVGPSSRVSGACDGYSGGHCAGVAGESPSQPSCSRYYTTLTRFLAAHGTSVKIESSSDSRADLLSSNVFVRSTILRIF